jgi:hypothetical protein
MVMTVRFSFECACTLFCLSLGGKLNFVGSTVAIIFVRNG